MAKNRVLILRDPRHHHDPRGGDVVLETLKSAGFEATLTEDVSCVTRLSEIDCLTLYTQGETFDPQQVETLTKWVRGGGGLVGVHTATATNKKDDAYARLIGSRFIGHGPVFDFKVHVSDPEHPLAHRIQDYRITDELYLLQGFDDFHVFLEAWWQGKKQP